MRDLLIVLAYLVFLVYVACYVTWRQREADLSCNFGGAVPPGWQCVVLK